MIHIHSQYSLIQNLNQLHVHVLHHLTEVVHESRDAELHLVGQRSASGALRPDALSVPETVQLVSQCGAHLAGRPVVRVAAPRPTAVLQGLA